MKGTAFVGLLYKKGESKKIWGYVDASHTSCPDNNKGRVAYVFMSGGAPVSRASKRELRAEMYRDIGKTKVKVKCIDLMTDSQSAKSLAENPVYHGRSKHILAKWHFIRQRVTKGWIQVDNVRPEFMGADMLTK